MSTAIRLVNPGYQDQVNTTADLRAYPVANLLQGTTILVKGRDAFNDHLGGLFVWDENNTDPDDNFTTIRSNNSSVGRWLSFITSSGDAIFDSLTVNGGVTIDATSATGVYPVKFLNSNVYSNLDLYGSGTVVVRNTGQNSNQPILMSWKSVNDSIYGNAASLVLKNDGGTGVTAASAYDVDLEFVANNPNVNAYGGKSELRQVSNRSGGTFRYRDGVFQISPRAADLSGAPNGQFEPCFYFMPNSSVGLGYFETVGNGILLNPKYDYSIASNITMTNPFQNTVWTNTATLTGKTAQIIADGMGASSLEVNSHENVATTYIRSDVNNAYIQMRGSQTSGTGASLIDMFSGTSGKFWRLIHINTNNDFSISHYNGTSTLNMFNISTVNDGLVQIRTISASKNGKIRLGDGSGTAGGGQISYTGDTGVLDITGTNNYITMGSSGTIHPTRINSGNPSTGGTVTIGAFETDYIITSALLANLTVTLPTAPVNGHQVSIVSVGGVTTLSVTSGSTVSGAPTTLAANAFFTMIYKTSTDTWYRKG